MEKMSKTNILSSHFYVYISGELIIVNDNLWPIGSNWLYLHHSPPCLPLMLHSSHCRAPRFDGFGHQALRIDVVHNGLSEMLPGTLDKSRKKEKTPKSQARAFEGCKR